jgi:hypothetical protein
MTDSLGSAGHFPPILVVLIAVLALFWLGGALGHRVLTWSRVPLVGATAPERAFFAVALGAGLLQYLPYALASFGWLSPRALSLGTLGLAVLLSADLLRVARVALAALRGLRLARPTPASALLGLVAGVVLLILLAHTSVIAELGEDDGYHLGAPKRWLVSGTLAYLPSYTNTNASMGFEMLYAIGLACWGAVAAKAFNLAAGIAALVGLVLASRRLSPGDDGVTAPALLMIGSPLVNLGYVFVLAYVDLGMCWMVAASILGWLIWHEQLERGGSSAACPLLAPLLLMGLFAGLAGSFKSTSIVIVLAWLPPVALALLRAGWKKTRILGAVVAFGAVAALPILPWFYRNLRNTGNPLYPMAPNVIPTRDFTPEFSVVFGKFVRYFSWANASAVDMTEGQRKLIVAGGALLILFLGGLAIALLRRRALRGLLLFATGYLVLVVVLAGVVPRYWLPGAMCVALTACCVAHQRWPKLIQTRIPAALFATLALGTLLRLSVIGHDKTSDFKIAFGVSTTAREFRDRPLWKIWQHINAHTEADARVLLASFYNTFGASTELAFWVDRECFVTDAHLQRYIVLDSWPEFVASVHAASIDYVVVANRQFIGKRLGLSFPAGDNEFAFSQRLAAEYGQKLYEAGDIAFYRLAVPPTASTR